MLTGGKHGATAKRKEMKADSSDDLGKIDFEEGKSVSLGELSMRSP